MKMMKRADYSSNCSVSKKLTIHQSYEASHPTQQSSPSSMSRRLVRAAKGSYVGDQAERYCDGRCQERPHFPLVPIAM